MTRILARRRASVPWAAVRIATWNVNSVKQRVPRLLPWLDERRPDVVCLQETKLADDAFAELLGDELAEPRVRGRGPRRAGVERRRDPLARRARGRRRRARRAARASRIRRRARWPRPAAAIRVVSVYVPNGREPDSEHYRYKLEWLAALRAMVAAGPGRRPSCAAT